MKLNVNNNIKLKPALFFNLISSCIFDWFPPILMENNYYKNRHFLIESLIAIEVNLEVNIIISYIFSENFIEIPQVI